MASPFLGCTTADAAAVVPATSTDENWVPPTLDSGYGKQLVFQFPTPPPAGARVYVCRWRVAASFLLY